MGRNRKYKSKDELKCANNEKVKRFYWKNKTELDMRAKAYYWRKKIKECLENGNKDEAEKILQKALSKNIDEQYLIL